MKLKEFFKDYITRGFGSYVSGFRRAGFELPRRQVCIAHLGSSLGLFAFKEVRINQN